MGKPLINMLAVVFIISLQGYATVQSSHVQIQNVDALNLSPKLQAYVRKVERQTHRKVVFERRASSGPVEFPAWFEADRSHVWIVISPSIDLTSPDAMTSPEAEWVIAHEMTHGILYYARRYFQLKPIKPLSKNLYSHLAILATMLDDIPVHKLVQKEGFNVMFSTYLTTVKQESDAARAKRKDIYPCLEGDPSYLSHYMVFRYILAWSLLEYFHWDQQTNDTLREFLMVFEKSYPEELSRAITVREIIKHHNIFTAQGHREIVKKMLKLWGFNRLIRVAN